MVELYNNKFRGGIGDAEVTAIKELAEDLEFIGSHTMGCPEDCALCTGSQVLLTLLDYIMKLESEIDELNADLAGDGW